jgi:hypothetical protein
MLRHLLRTASSLIALGVCLVFLSGETKAQGLLGGQAGILDDPFTFYYAFYLPNQQQQAMRATPMDTLNQAVAERQFYARNNMRNVTNPVSPYADQGDPLAPYSRQQGGERLGRPYVFSQNPSNSDGGGPSLYYGRAGAFFPNLREGRSRNANVYVRKAFRGGNRAGGAAGMGGGMGGMGGMGMGMPNMGAMGGGMGMM